MYDTYGPVHKAMKAGTPLDVICGTCPWDRLCIRPPEMTPEGIKESTEAVMAEAREQGVSESSVMTVKLTALAINHGRDVMGLMCPVLATRLQAPEGRQIADAVRVTMQNLDSAG